MAQNTATTVTGTSAHTAQMNANLSARAAYSSGMWVGNSGSHSHSVSNTVVNSMWFKINHDNDIELDNGDLIAAEELVKTFKYLKEEHPNVFADLILKGIIK